MSAKLYEIALPVTDNSGMGYAGALLAWEALALERAGGFTSFPEARGCWRGDDGRVYTDTMRPYRVLCSPAAMRALVFDAFRLFPDQVAIFVATIGTAEIINRGDMHAHSGGPRC